MLDGPTSFLIVMALVGMAAIGALGLLMCIAAFLSSRFRQQAISALVAGVCGALLALAAMCVLLSVVLTGADRRASLLIQWCSVAALAGFGCGVSIRIALGFLRRSTAG